MNNESTVQLNVTPDQFAIIEVALMEMKLGQPDGAPQWRTSALLSSLQQQYADLERELVAQGATGIKHEPDAKCYHCWACSAAHPDGRTDTLHVYAWSRSEAVTRLRGVLQAGWEFTGQVDYLGEV